MIQGTYGVPFNLLPLPRLRRLTWLVGRKRGLSPGSRSRSGGYVSGVGCRISRGSPSRTQTIWPGAVSDGTNLVPVEVRDLSLGTRKARDSLGVPT